MVEKSALFLLNGDPKSMEKGSLCACGCGMLAGPRKIFINGHNRRDCRSIDIRDLRDVALIVTQGINELDTIRNRLIFLKIKLDEEDKKNESIQNDKEIRKTKSAESGNQTRIDGAGSHLSGDQEEI